MKNAVFLLLAAGILGALYYGTKEPTYTERAETPGGVSALQAFVPAKATSITLKSATEAVTIEKQSDRWVVPTAWNYAADEQRVDRFLQAIRRTSDAELRGSSATVHDKFEIGPEKGIEVSIASDSGSIEFVVGKGSAQGVTGCYLRFPPEEAVYFTRTELVSAGGLWGGEVASRDWLQRAIYEPPANEELAELILTTPDGVIHLVGELPGAPEDDDAAEDEDTADEDDAETPAIDMEIPDEPTWKLVKPEAMPADETNASALVGSVSRKLDCYDVVDPALRDQYGLEPPERKAEMVFRDGTRMTLLFGGPHPPKDETDTTKRVYAQLEGKPQIYVVQEWARDRFFKTLEELTPPPGPIAE